MPIGLQPSETDSKREFHSRDGMRPMRRKELFPGRDNSIRITVNKVREPVKVIPYVNRAPLPTLSRDWKLGLREAFPNFLSERNLVDLEDLITFYVNERVALTNPITWNSMIEQLQDLSTASRSLAEAVSKRSPGDSIWRKIEKEASPNDLTLAT